MKNALQIFDIASSRVRALFYSSFGGIKFKKVGRNLKLYGAKSMAGTNISLGDNCWLEAVREYNGIKFSPVLELGDGCMLSSNVHISLVKKIKIGRGCLLGSNIYIGDHSHGSTLAGKFDHKIAPAKRLLDDIADIEIGENVWIGDGVVILAGTYIPAGSIVGANSVVKGIFTDPSVIAGAPAKSVRKLV